MTFEIKAIRYTRETFLARVAALTWKKGWRPARICLHNMGSPDISQGMKTPEADREAVFKHYYQSMGWHSGPHLSIWPDAIWELCDLEQDGVHASCFNRGPLTSIGAEMLGDFSPGADDFHSGLGAQIRDNATFALAALYRQMWGHPEDLLFHRDCKADHHLCPGLSVDKDDMIARIKAEMTAHAGQDRTAHGFEQHFEDPSEPTWHEHTPPPAVPPPLNSVATAAQPLSVGDIAGLQRALNRLGGYTVEVSGELRPDTIAMVAWFQRKNGLTPDGLAGRLTVAAINETLAKRTAP